MGQMCDGRLQTRAEPLRLRSCSEHMPTTRGHTIPMELTVFFASVAVSCLSWPQTWGASLMADACEDLNFVYIRLWLYARGKGLGTAEYAYRHSRVDIVKKHSSAEGVYEVQDCGSSSGAVAPGCLLHVCIFHAMPLFAMLSARAEKKSYEQITQVPEGNLGLSPRGRGGESVGQSGHPDCAFCTPWSVTWVIFVHGGD